MTPEITILILLCLGAPIVLVLGLFLAALIVEKL